MKASKKEKIKSVISLFGNMLSFILNFFISSFNLYAIPFSFSTFFNISSNVVWQVHVSSFFTGLLPSLFLLLKIEPFTNRNALLFSS